MSADCSQPRLIATWNPARGVWETTQTAICEHLEPYSQTWPTSGMTRAGVAYERPTPARLMDGSASSLLPTPTRRDHKGRNQRNDNTCLPGAVNDYGQYAPAIARWEHVLGEPAPPPTIQGAKGPRLNPDLTRWMMGFPPGWLDGLTPTQQLKAAGNAVCQQQAELALRILLGDS